MERIADAAAVLVALLHLWFLVLEMFLWQKPLGRKTFGHSAEDAARTAVLAKNQGLYNGFLAAGIVFGLLTGAPDTTVFFLACVVIAGIHGAITAAPAILLVQSLPAAVALLLRFL